MSQSTTGLRAERAHLKDLLGEPDFRFLLSSQFVAQAADGFVQATFANLLVLEPLSAHTPSEIFYLFALTLLPYSLISPFLGVFVDRWARRSLMQWSNVIRAVMIGTLPLWRFALPGKIGLYAAMLLLLSFGRLFLTTKGALLPVLLHEHHLIRGNSTSSGGGMIAALIGGTVGLFASNALGESTSFVLAGVFYLVAAFLVRKLSEPFSHPHARADNIGAAVIRISSELFEGVRAIWTAVRARLALIGIFLVRTIGMFVFIAAVLVIKHVYPGKLEDFGRLSTAAVALGAAGVGAFVGALTAPAAGRRFEKGGLILLGFAVSGIGIVALGGIENLPALLLLTFFGGYGGFVTKVAVDAQVQEALPDELRGRAFALYDILFNLASVVAAGLFVMTGSSENLRPILVLAGCLSLVLSVILGFAMARAGIEMVKTSPASAPGA